MKTTLLKMSVITTMAFFLLAGTSWADRGKDRHHQTRNKHMRTDHDRSDRYSGWSHNGRGWDKYPRRHYKKHYDRHRAAHRAERHYLKHHRKYHRPVHKHDYYRHKVVRKHYHKHKPSYNGFSHRAPFFEPGWSITFHTKSRW